MADEPTMIPPTRMEPVDQNASMNRPAVTPPAPAPTGTPTTPVAPKAAERPEWLPQKFKTAEEMALSYKELEKRLSSGKPAETPPATETPKPAEGEKPNDLQIKAVEKAAADAGLNYDDLNKEFVDNGKLSDDTYAKIAAKGFPKEVVDAHIAGLQALQQQSLAEMTKDVGGTEGYAKIAQWAASSLPKAELEAYNRVVTGQDVNAAKLALAGLHAKYTKSIEPNFLRAAENGASGGDVFRSTAEITAAIRDPRYKADAAYRHDVEQKIGRSNI